MIVVQSSQTPSDTPQPAGRRFQFGLRAFLLFALIAGPLLALAVKWVVVPAPSVVVPTSGVVLRTNGSPAAGVNVSFLGTGRAYMSSGITDATGAFELSTFQENDGAVPGNYSVTITDSSGVLLSAPAIVAKTKNVFRFTVP
jgi:hypothetical protein